MAAESLFPPDPMQLIFDTVEQIEHWVGIAKDVSAKELTTAIHEICGNEKKQVSVLRRLTLLRKELDLFGHELDKPIEQRMQALANLAGPSKVIMAVSPYILSSINLASCDIAGTKFGFSCLRLDDKREFYELFEVHSFCVSKVSGSDGAMSIQRDLVHSFHVIGEMTIHIELYWHRTMTLWMHDRYNCDKLVESLETFTGKSRARGSWSRAHRCRKADPFDDSLNCCGKYAAETGYQYSFGRSSTVISPAIDSTRERGC